MDVVRPHCEADKFPGKTAGMCCAHGKVKLLEFEPSPEPLQSLIFGTSPEPKRFSNHTQEYNSSFQMTSFGATQIISDQYTPTFEAIARHV